MVFWHRVRRILGLHDTLLVVAFLTANTAVEVALSVAGSTYRQLGWLAGLGVLTAVLAIRSARRGRPSVEVLTGTEFGVYGNARLTRRRGAVVLVGLGSDDPSSALAHLLAGADSLEFIALIGTHETRELGVVDRVRSRLFAQVGVTVPAENLRVWEHNHAMSVGDYAQSVSEALAWLRRCGVSGDDVVVDISDGRRMAGFGALQAADAHRVETQYLAFAWDHAAHRPITDAPAFRVVSPYSDETRSARDAELRSGFYVDEESTTSGERQLAS